MSSQSSQYGIFIQNYVVKDNTNSQNERSVFLGQMCVIEAVLANSAIQIRLMIDDESLDTQTYTILRDNIVVLVPSKLRSYVASIVSPQERIKLAKNKNLCEKLSQVSINSMVGFTTTSDVKLGKVRYMGPVKAIGFCFGLELHVRYLHN